MRLRTGGFTLLEVLLASTFLTFGLVFVMGTISTGLFSGAVNEAELVAVNLIQEKAEEIRNASYANVVTETKTALPPASGFSQFSRSVSYTTPQTGLKEVTITVYWYTKKDEVSPSLVTYVSSV